MPANPFINGVPARDIVALLRDYSAPIANSSGDAALILAAGHGKRIRSERSKMLHTIWGVPTVSRVARAAAEGLESSNQVIVLGIKAPEVAEILGRRDQRVFVYQEKQLGTGDAVRVGLEPLRECGFAGDIYVFPGDMGLLDKEAVSQFRVNFHANVCDMIVLTADFTGDPADNYYGRIIRVPDYDAHGQPSGGDRGNVIEIKEHRDILSLPVDRPYEVVFHGRTYRFTRDELIRLREFNTGVYGFQAAPLLRLIARLSANNAQGELYMTDLIAIFNQNNLTVRSSRAQDMRTVLAFNNKSVLNDMERIARERVYDRIKDIITIDDKDDFFIADEVVQDIIRLDREQAPLDIRIGKGVFVSSGVRLAKGVILKDRAVLKGNIDLGANVMISENVIMRTYAGQRLNVGAGTEILTGNIIQGNITIGTSCRIESGVKITGSDPYPTRIGANALVKGMTYIFGSIIDDDVHIEHSVLKCKHVERVVRKNGSVQPVRWILPLPEGLDSVRPLSNAAKSPSG